MLSVSSKPSNSTHPPEWVCPDICLLCHHQLCIFEIENGDYDDEKSDDIDGGEDDTDEVADV